MITRFAIAGLHRLDGVAGIDRPLEGVGRHDRGDVGDLHHVEERGDARHDVLAGGGRRRDQRVVAVGERDDQRRQRFGEMVGEAVGIGDGAPWRRRRASPLRRRRRRNRRRRPARGRRRRARSRRRARGRSPRPASHCRGRRSAGWSQDARLVLQLVDQLGDGGDPGAALAAAAARRPTARSAAARGRRRVRPALTSAIGFFFAFMMLGSEA